jgi:hypothetical protein
MASNTVKLRLAWASKDLLSAGTTPEEAAEIETRKADIEAAVEEGDTSNGIGLMRAKQFLRHPFIRDLFKARKARMDEIERLGGAEDAFGGWISCQEDSCIRSILARQVQSYELRLMLAMLPVIKEAADVQILSWLHDGVTLGFDACKSSNAILEAVQHEVLMEARRLNIYTQLEREFD